MTKHLLFALSLGLLAACGGKKNQTEQPIQDNPITIAPQITYEAFVADKLQGKWKVIDAGGYSKDKMMGQVYEFVGDTATFYKDTGDGGMAKGAFTVEGDALKIKYSKRESNGTSTMTFSYTGGFFENGTKLQLDDMSSSVTLQKQ